MSQLERFEEAHAMTSSQVMELLSTTVDGLTTIECQGRRASFGENFIPQGEAAGALKIALRQIRSPLIYILLASAAIAFIMGKPTDGAVVSMVVFINAVIGFFQEFRAGKAMQALSALIPEKVRVTRNREQCEVDARCLVPGDIVHLQSGEKVPADLRIFEAKRLRIEEAALTGESVPAEKVTAPVPRDAVIGDRLNMAFGGTSVVFGQGKGIVTATGPRTELGRIAGLIKTTSKDESPLTKSLETIGQLLTIGISVVAALLFVMSLLRGFALVDAVLAAITLAVAAIPEGLPSIITVSLAIGVHRMAMRKVIIRRLPAVETLGSTSVICSDKTGTLTKNEMTVQALWTPSAAYRVTGIGYGREGTILLDGGGGDSKDDLRNLLEAGVLCNDSEMRMEHGDPRVHGDPTEGALIVTFVKAGGVVQTLMATHPRLDSIPFESERQFMATLHRSDKSQVLFLKGAPEVILKSVSADEGVRDKARERVSAYAGKGMRVLAFARKAVDRLSIAENDTKAGFQLLGLQAMIDPPREEVIRAIDDCHRAGIVVKMITGDHQETAEAIARQLGIATPAPALTGTRIQLMSDRELDHAVSLINVFARVAPEHKLRLVRSLQRLGHVTAMTGDGVNDAPALKQADIGIAMGLTGTPVSKEAADLILLDDNFATIRTAVEEGRRIFDNLAKALAFVLPTNLGQALIILFAVALLPTRNGHVLMPILPVQILWINLVASVALSLPLAFEAVQPDVMSRPPRAPRGRVFSGFLLWRTLLVGVLIAASSIALFLSEMNASERLGEATETVVSKAQTMAVTTVIFFQIFYFLQCRSLKTTILKIGFFSNPWAFLGIGTVLLLQLAFVHMPVFQTFFHSSPLSLADWLKSIAAGALIIPVIALEKAFGRLKVAGRNSLFGNVRSKRKIIIQ